ncbi:MAG: hypothetical protein M0Z66_08755 [Thermaerobacter sp.]|nr:hypothetical protein [Thermaerobacter sp.]
MAVRQVFLPARGLSALVDAQGIRVAAAGRVTRSDLPALALGVGPGERLLALCADGCLWQVGTRHSQRLWESIDALSADPHLLAAVQGGQRLLLEGERSCTSVSLPARPQGLAALGGGGSLPHLALLMLANAAWLIGWNEEEGAVRVLELFRGPAAEGALLEGSPALLALREPARFGATRLHLWNVLCDGGMLRFVALAPLFLDPALPLALRNGPGGPVALCGTGRWAVWRHDRWSFEHLRSALAHDFLPTRIYGNPAALEPYPPAVEKEPLPRRNKLAVSALARRT